MLTQAFILQSEYQSIDLYRIKRRKVTVAAVWNGLEKNRKGGWGSCQGLGEIRAVFMGVWPVYSHSNPHLGTPALVVYCFSITTLEFLILIEPGPLIFTFSMDLANYVATGGFESRQWQWECSACPFLIEVWPNLSGS